MLFYLTYISKAVRPMTDFDLKDILNSSVTNNTALHITGMLLYIEGDFASQKGGRFMQVLEGYEQDVKELYAKIKTDSRHHNLILLNQHYIEDRNFKTWSMGFKSMGLDQYRRTPGYFELDEHFMNHRDYENFNAPLNFLKSFYGMTRV